MSSWVDHSWLLGRPRWGLTCRTADYLRPQVSPKGLEVEARSDDPGLCTGIPVDLQIQNDAFGGLGAADEDVAFGWWFDRIR